MLAVDAIDVARDVLLHKTVPLHGVVWATGNRVVGKFGDGRTCASTSLGSGGSWWECSECGEGRQDGDWCGGVCVHALVLANEAVSNGREVLPVDGLRRRLAGLSDGELQEVALCLLLQQTTHFDPDHAAHHTPGNVTIANPAHQPAALLQELLAASRAPPSLPRPPPASLFTLPTNTPAASSSSPAALRVVLVDGLYRWSLLSPHSPVLLALRPVVGDGGNGGGNGNDSGGHGDGGCPAITHVPCGFHCPCTRNGFTGVPLFWCRHVHALAACPDRGVLSYRALRKGLARLSREQLPELVLQLVWEGDGLDNLNTVLRKRDYSCNDPRPRLLPLPVAPATQFASPSAFVRFVVCEGAAQADSGSARADSRQARQWPLLRPVVVQAFSALRCIDTRAAVVALVALTCADCARCDDHANLDEVVAMWRALSPRARIVDEALDMLDCGPAVNRKLLWVVREVAGLSGLVGVALSLAERFRDNAVLANVLRPAGSTPRVLSFPPPTLRNDLWELITGCVGGGGGGGGGGGKHDDYDDNNNDDGGMSAGAAALVRGCEADGAVPSLVLTAAEVVARQLGDLQSPSAVKAVIDSIPPESGVVDTVAKAVWELVSRRLDAALVDMRVADLAIADARALAAESHLVSLKQLAALACSPHPSMACLLQFLLSCNWNPAVQSSFCALLRKCYSQRGVRARWGAGGSAANVATNRRMRRRRGGRRGGRGHRNNNNNDDDNIDEHNDRDHDHDSDVALASTGENGEGEGEGEEEEGERAGEEEEEEEEGEEGEEVAHSSDEGSENVDAAAEDVRAYGNTLVDELFQRLLEGPTDQAGMVRGAEALCVLCPVVQVVPHALRLLARRPGGAEQAAEGDHDALCLVPRTGATAIATLLESTEGTAQVMDRVGDVCAALQQALLASPALCALSVECAVALEALVMLDPLRVVPELRVDDLVECVCSALLEHELDACVAGERAYRHHVFLLNALLENHPNSSADNEDDDERPNAAAGAHALPPSLLPALSVCLRPPAHSLARGVPVPPDRLCAAHLCARSAVAAVRAFRESRHPSEIAARAGRTGAGLALEHRNGTAVWRGLVDCGLLSVAVQLLACLPWREELDPDDEVPHNNNNDDNNNASARADDSGNAGGSSGGGAGGGGSGDDRGARGPSSSPHDQFLAECLVELLVEALSNTITCSLVVRLCLDNDAALATAAVLVLGQGERPRTSPLRHLQQQQQQQQWPDAHGGAVGGHAASGAAAGGGGGGGNGSASADMEAEAARQNFLALLSRVGSLSASSRARDLHAHVILGIVEHRHARLAVHQVVAAVEAIAVRAARNRSSAARSRARPAAPQGDLVLRRRRGDVEPSLSSLGRLRQEEEEAAAGGAGGEARNLAGRATAALWGLVAHVGEGAACPKLLEELTALLRAIATLGNGTTGLVPPVAYRSVQRLVLSVDARHVATGVQALLEHCSALVQGDDQRWENEGGKGEAAVAAVELGTALRVVRTGGKELGWVSRCVRSASLPRVSDHLASASLAIVAPVHERLRRQWAEFMRPDARPVPSAGTSVFARALEQSGLLKLPRFEEDQATREATVSKLVRALCTPWWLALLADWRSDGAQDGEEGKPLDCRLALLEKVDKGTRAAASLDGLSRVVLAAETLGEERRREPWFFASYQFAEAAEEVQAHALVLAIVGSLSVDVGFAETLLKRWAPTLQQAVLCFGVLRPEALGRTAHHPNPAVDLGKACVQVVHNIARHARLRVGAFECFWESLASVLEAPSSEGTYFAALQGAIELAKGAQVWQRMRESPDALRVLAALQERTGAKVEGLERLPEAISAGLQAGRQAGHGAKRRRPRQLQGEEEGAGAKRPKA